SHVNVRSARGVVQSNIRDFVLRRVGSAAEVSRGSVQVSLAYRKRGRRWLASKGPANQYAEHTNHSGTCHAPFVAAPLEIIARHDRSLWRLPEGWKEDVLTATPRSFYQSEQDRCQSATRFNLPRAIIEIIDP